MKEEEMSFLGHIGALRGHLIRSLIAIIVGAFIVGFNINWIMDHVFFGPTKNSFVTFEVINKYSMQFLGEKSMVLPDNFRVQQKKMMQQFNVMMSVSIFGGLILSFPYIIWELWRFISPALHPKERKNSVFTINFIWILFMCGVVTGYFLILPLVINFGLLFTISDSIEQLFDLTDYTALFLQIVIGMGIVFLFPVIVYFLTSLGILTPAFMKKYRRHAVVMVMVVAAIITPADVLSMMAAAVPLLLLYEFSIIMSRIVFNRMQKELKKNELVKTK